MGLDRWRGSYMLAGTARASRPVGRCMRAVCMVEVDA